MNKYHKREFAEALKNLLRKVNRIDRNEMFCHGVTVSQCQIIDILHDHNEISMNQLSGETGLAMSTLTRIVDLLVRDEIVMRERKPDDRRKVIVTLTEKGRELQGKLKSCFDEYTLEILRKIPEERREDVVNVLNLLDSAVSTHLYQCCSISKGEKN